MERLSTGNQELDAILNGGLPIGSFVAVAGPPGTGKSVLSHQVAFTNATPDRPAHYYSSLSESQSKVKRHLRGLAFFDEERLGADVRLFQLEEFAGRAQDEGRGLEAVVDEIIARTFEQRPAVVVVDSSRSLEAYGSSAELRAATYRLASTLAHSDAVLIFVGEYGPGDGGDTPEFAVADVILELTNDADMARDRRTVRVVKLRGSQFIGGRHPFTITADGFGVHRRLESVVEPLEHVLDGRAVFDDDELNRMTGGGLPRGDVAIVLGPTGTGKTTLAMQWVRAALDRGESALYVALEEHPAGLVARADGFGLGFGDALADGRLRIVDGPANLADPDEVAHAIRGALAEAPPDVVVVDAITSLLPALQREGRSPLFETALVSLVRGVGATSLFLYEVQSMGSGDQPTGGLSHLANTVILLRYMERGSELGHVLSVLKMRRSAHDKGLLQYTIGGDGFEVLGEADDVRQITGWSVLGSPTAG